MSREWLRDAGDRLHDAADRADRDEARERLRELGDQLTALADRERGPDHGRLARLLNAIGEVEGKVDDSVAAELDEAREQVVRYRETVEGV